MYIKTSHYETPWCHIFLRQKNHAAAWHWVDVIVIRITPCNKNFSHFCISYQSRSRFTERTCFTSGTRFLWSVKHSTVWNHPRTGYSSSQKNENNTRNTKLFSSSLKQFVVNMESRSCKNTTFSVILLSSWFLNILIGVFCVQKKLLYPEGLSVRRKAFKSEKTCIHTKYKCVDSNEMSQNESQWFDHGREFFFLRSGNFSSISSVSLTDWSFPELKSSLLPDNLRAPCAFANVKSPFWLMNISFALIFENKYLMNPTFPHHPNLSSKYLLSERPLLSTCNRESPKWNIFAKCMNSRLIFRGERMMFNHYFSWLM